jgi:hypothetical protein
VWAAGGPLPGSAGGALGSAAACRSQDGPGLCRKENCVFVSDAAGNPSRHVSTCSLPPAPLITDQPLLGRQSHINTHIILPAHHAAAGGQWGARACSAPGLAVEGRVAGRAHRVVADALVVVRAAALVAAPPARA